MSNTKKNVGRNVKVTAYQNNPRCAPPTDAGVTGLKAALKPYQNNPRVPPSERAIELMNRHQKRSTKEKDAFKGVLLATVAAWSKSWVLDHSGR